MFYNFKSNDIIKIIKFDFFTMVNSTGAVIFRVTLIRESIALTLSLNVTMFNTVQKCVPKALGQNKLQRILIQVYPNYNYGSVIVNVYVGGASLDCSMSFSIPNPANSEAWNATNAA